KLLLEQPPAGIGANASTQGAVVEGASSRRLGQRSIGVNALAEVAPNTENLIVPAEAGLERCLGDEVRRNVGRVVGLIVEQATQGARTTDEEIGVLPRNC